MRQSAGDWGLRVSVVVESIADDLRHFVVD